MDTVEVLIDDKTVNDWISRMDEPDVRKYMSSEPIKGYEQHLRSFRRLVRVTGGGWLDLPGILHHHRNRWLREGKLTECTLDYSLEDPVHSWLSEKKTNAQHIVFCEGQWARLNPFWNWLPFEPAKGEILTLHIPEFPESEILTQGIFFIPLGNHRFRVGSTYSWDPLDAVPTEEAKQEILQKVERIIRDSFSVEDHQAGVRPVGKERRPFAGRHPQKTNWYVLNGLGSKGSTLAPYLTFRLLEFIENGNQLLEEMDIQRYYPS